MIKFIGYVFMAGTMLVINDRDWAYPRYYLLNNPIDTLRRCVLVQLSDKILDACKYLFLYRFALQMGADPAWTVLAAHKCSEIDFTKTALQDGFLSYDIKNGKIPDLEEEDVLAGKHARGTSVISTSVILPAVPFCTQVRYYESPWGWCYGITVSIVV